MHVLGAVRVCMHSRAELAPSRLAATEAGVLGRIVRFHSLDINIPPCFRLAPCETPTVDHLAPPPSPPTSSARTRHLPARSAAHRTATSLGAHPVPSIASYPYVNKASSPTLAFASNTQEQRSCGEPQHLSLTHYPRQHHHYPLRAHCRRPSHPRHCSRSRLDTTRFCGLAPTTARAGTGTHPS
jgi:hypothetical protein